MNLYDVVYQLVCANDCVIIPGFGGFVANRFPANVDFSKQEFCPPSRKVAFNESLSLSDGLLINHVSQTAGVPWEEADNMVREFVADLNAKLSEGKSVAFDGLGEFSRKSECLVFVSSSANLLDESFGLISFNYPMLRSASKLQVESAIVGGNEVGESKNKRKNRILAWSLSSAAAVIVGLVCLSLYMGWFTYLFGNSEENTAVAGIGIVNSRPVQETVVEEKEIVSVVETEDVVTEELTEDEVAEVEFAEAEPIVEESTSEEIVENVEESTVYNEVEPVSAPVVVENDVEYKVHIIAGCFSNYSNAENVYKNLLSNGLAPQILPMDKGLYKVSVKGFASVADACAELQSLKDLTGNELLWIMKM